MINDSCFQLHRFYIYTNYNMLIGKTWNSCWNIFSLENVRSLTIGYKILCTYFRIYYVTNVRWIHISHHCIIWISTIKSQKSPYKVILIKILLLCITLPLSEERSIETKVMRWVRTFKGIIKSKGYTWQNKSILHKKNYNGIFA